MPQYQLIADNCIINVATNRCYRTDTGAYPLAHMTEEARNALGVRSYTAPPTPEPTPAEALAAWRATAELPRRQALQMLRRKEKLNALKNLRNQMTEEQLIDLDESAIWKRNWPNLEVIRQILGWTAEEVDEMFREGMEREAQGL